LMPSRETGGAQLNGEFVFRWSKRKNNTLEVSVLPYSLGSDMPPGIYVQFRIRKGGMSSIWSQSHAKMYFPFKKYQVQRSSNMPVTAMLEELDFYHDEIVECMSILVPLGSKTVSSMPPEKFYGEVWPLLEKYAAPQMAESIENWKSYTAKL
jgi:hypothetical protein